MMAFLAGALFLGCAGLIAAGMKPPGVVELAAVPALAGCCFFALGAWQTGLVG
jgi:hypothetical protein